MASPCQLFLTSKAVLAVCVRGVEMGQQIRLVLLWMAYGICVHQGAPLKSAGVESGVSQRRIRWGNPNIPVFWLCGSVRAGIKDFAMAAHHVSVCD